MLNNTNSLQTIPARSGRAVSVESGQSLRIINTHGHQVVDTWAFNRHDLEEHLSLEHWRATVARIFVQVGDELLTNQRRPIVDLVEDTSPGVHDTLMAACDVHRYKLLGCTEYHDNCTDNLREALGDLGLTSPTTPSPLNLWMNIPVANDGSTQWCEPTSKPGDYVVLKARMDCVVAMSCCPQDMVPVNAGNPTEAHFELLE